MDKNKKDIGLLTLHKVSNYGSLLQCFALYKYLEKINYSVVVIDFVPNRLKISNLAKNTKKKFPINILVYIIKYVQYIFINNRINTFLNNNLNLTKLTYHNSSDLSEKLPEVKAFLAGSDQIWNSSHNKGIEGSFFLDFVPSNIIKATYAASFGKEVLQNWEKDETFKLINNIDHVSVREKSSQDILDNLGIPDSFQNVDPVFLLTKEDWGKYLNENKPSNDYVVIYEVNNENLDKLYNVASTIAKSKNLEIHIIKTTQTKKDLKGYDKVYNGITPFNFLEVLRDAKYIVTGSFHGTAFSINLNKQFYVVLPLDFSTRLYNILDICGLTNRIVTEDSIDSVLDSKIDFKNVNGILDVERTKSRDYLLGLLD